MIHLEEIASYLIGSVLCSILVLFGLLIPSILLSLIYKTKTEESVLSNLRSIYPKFGILSILVGPQFYLLIETVVFPHRFSVINHILSMIVSIGIILSVLTIWHRYKKRNGVEEKYSIRDVLLSSIGLLTLLIFVLPFSYMFLFHPHTGPSVACDMGVMWDDELCEVSSGSLQFSLEYNSNKSAYNATITQASATGYKYYFINATDGTTLATIDSVGEQIKITGLKRGERIKLVGRAEDGMRRFLGYYTVAD